MKLIIFIKGLGLGGAERHAVDTAIAMQKKGVDVVVAYIIPTENTLEAELKNAGIATVCIGKKRWWLTAIPNFFNLAKKFKPDTVHTHLPIPGIIARLLKPVCRYRLVYTEHNMIQRLHPLTKFFHQLTHSLNDAAISCSEAVSGSLPWPSIVIDNGIFVPDTLPQITRPGNIRTTLNIGLNTVIFVCIANLLKKKNHTLLLDAFEKAFSASPDDYAALVLIGQDGTERSNLEHHISTLKTRKNIHLWGSHPHAAELLEDADVFCLSSSFEGLPIALLESMAIGIPSVVTNVGGMPDTVVNNVTGIVVNSGDTNGYATALEKLAANAELRYQMGDEAFTRAQNLYSQMPMINALLEIYHRKDT